MSCTVVAELCKRSDERVFRSIDLTGYCARRWVAGAIVANGMALRPAALDDGGGRGPTGYEYVNQTAGQAGSKEPKWTGPSGVTIPDGSLSWLSQAISNASLERTIANTGSIVLSAPVGYTVTLGALQNTNGKQQFGIFTSGGADGDEDVLIIASVTFNEADGGTTVEDFAISVSVHDDGTDD